MAKCKQASFRDLGVKPKKPKEVFGADVTGPHHISLSDMIIAWRWCVFTQDMDIHFLFERRVTLFSNSRI